MSEVIVVIFGARSIEQQQYDLHICWDKYSRTFFVRPPKFELNCEKEVSVQMNGECNTGWSVHSCSFRNFNNKSKMISRVRTYALFTLTVKTGHLKF